MLQCSALVQIILCFVCLQLGVVIKCTGVKTAQEFMMFWNMQTFKCEKSGIDLNLEKYDIIQNFHGSFYGDKINIFYDIGKFPYINSKGFINGGLPQLGNISAHLSQAQRDIDEIIPDENFSGLAILDWENWRPDWDTNWKPFNVYRSESIELVKKHKPNLATKEIVIEAKKQFEDSAQLFMQRLLLEAKKQRPHALWGYYGFPYCYNYNYLQKYCTKQIQTDNSEIQWLYNSSSALFPTIYISETNQTTISNAVYVYGQIQETRRVNKALNLPIFPYAIVHYRDTWKFMSKDDLLMTVGQAAALGLPGVIFWGRYQMANSKEKCENLEEYLRTIFGPTVKHIKATVESRSDRLMFDDSIPSEQWYDIIAKYFNK